jgi:carbonic anhydrase
MSCSTSNSPIDINSSNITGNCDSKCNYKYKYQSSSCVGKNLGNYISLSYDNSSSLINYNEISYYVKELRLYYPSLHSYNGNKADAELVIVHMSNTGEMPLLVCIPIKISSTSTPILMNVISTMARNAPTEGDSTTIKMLEYNLGRIIPKKGYYTYTATEPYQPCVETVNFIVYDINDTYLSMTSDLYNKLKNIIIQTNFEVKDGVQFFYNSKGPNTISEDDIYIDCQPVGESEETTTIINESYTENEYSWENLKNNDGFKLLIGIIIFLVILLIFNYFTIGIGIFMKGSENIKSMMDIT